jgi:group II intron reverse transcriptase/maturase
METVSTEAIQIAERAQAHPDEPLTNLHSFIDEAMLARCFEGLNKKGAPGVDGQTWHDYNEEKEQRIPSLLAGFKSGSYKAPAIRRTYIPKGDGRRRPLGMPTVEDKLLQTAVSEVLTPIYEQCFYPCSYGYRPGKSPHQALQALFSEVSFKGKRYIIDADVSNYFGNIDHGKLRKMLDLRIKDGVIRRMIDKWLKAGILEGGQLSYPESGTPQGGVISPLLANIYLHYALDKWFIEQIQPLLYGEGSLIRFADDFLLVFSNKKDLQRVMKVLSKHLDKFGLPLHPEKTRIIDLGSSGGEKSGTFDFLGFTHYMGRSRKGKPVLKRKTSGKKLRISLRGMNQWLKRNRHKPLPKLIAALNRKLQGHYGYYGMTFNYRKLNHFLCQTQRLLHKWLNRRGGKTRWSWEQVGVLTNQTIPLAKPRIVHSYVLAKP